ncbi:MAG: DUF2269 domain-containing protein, partial [Candidatus Thiodiazotropha sp. (ex Semelilucina semeliformis)]|nr:DUF2269 domain-containing protein [Candidatus Thiodiazotropha sp. (ex Semelilucina semeliformis)]
KLRRITDHALSEGNITEELERERGKLIPSFTHYLDLPMVFLIIALGAIKPTTWEMFFYGSVIAMALAAFFTVLIPRMYPWGHDSQGV